ncbi:hypothetical protein ACFFX0_16855 [Citricoccus parietis]|uniref:Uncharacterized protein n=1 Tax=Citricoccus parietis TaxID=592307 RepID=A0ABV5G2S7_9MICC
MPDDHEGQPAEEAHGPGDAAGRRRASGGEDIGHGSGESHQDEACAHGDHGRSVVACVDEGSGEPPAVPAGVGTPAQHQGDRADQDEEPHDAAPSSDGQ